MGFWTFLTIAVVCGCLLGGYSVYARSKTASGNGRLDDLEARLAGIEGHGSLEERVRALEAIVTDPRAQLGREIDGLKD